MIFLLPTIVLAVTTIGFNITTEGNILSLSNNASDLGAFGNAWRDVYASGSLRLGATGTNASGTLTAFYHGFSSTGTIQTTPTDNVGNVGLILNTAAAISNAGAKLISIREGGTELSYFDSTGGLLTPSSTITGALSITGSGTSTVITNGAIASTLGISGSGTSTSISGGLFASSINASTFLTVAGTSGTTTVLARALTTGLHSTGGLTSDNVLLIGGTASSSFAGALEVLGHTRLGNATSDLIDITGRVTTSILPNVDNVSDLGSNALRFQNIYAGTGIFSSSTIVGQGFNPSANNTYDLGTFGFAWRDLYASSTLRIGSATTSVSLDGRDLIFSGTSSIRSTPTDVASNAAFVFNTFNSPSNADLLRLQTNGTTQFSVGPAGVVSASGTISATGSGTSTYTGNLTVLGHTRLGDATSDLIQVTGQFTTSLLPNQNNTLDLGAFGNAWRDVYASGTLKIGINNSGTSTIYKGLETNFLDAATATLRSGLTVANTASIGWSVVAGADTACNTTCVNACVMGFSLAILSGSDPVACTDASADNCLCAGPN